MVGVGGFCTCVLCMFLISICCFPLLLMPPNGFAYDLVIFLNNYDNPNFRVNYIKEYYSLCSVFVD